MEPLQTSTDMIAATINVNYFNSHYAVILTPLRSKHKQIKMKNVKKCCRARNESRASNASSSSIQHSADR